MASAKYSPLEGTVETSKSYPLDPTMNSAAAADPPPLDPDIAAWILEFVLRQPIPDSLANEIFLALPISAPLSPRLRKTILLRRVASELSRRSVSDRTLHSLELIEELDRRTDGAATSDLMRDAYCSVAAECSVKSLRDPDGDFPSTVVMIWDHRMSDLERSEAAGLASSRLVEWRKKMKEAVGNPTVRNELLAADTEDQALNAVRSYLKDALKAMGPPFLEVAAEKFPLLVMGAAAKENGGRSELDECLDGTHFMELNGDTPPQSPGTDKDNGGDMATKHSANKFDPLPTPEVKNVAMALKTSSADLQMVVDDPLPDALVTAKNLEKPQENHCQVDENASVCAAEMGAGVPRSEGCRAGTMQNEDRDTVQFTGCVDPPPDSVAVNPPVQSAGSGAEVTNEDGNNTCIDWNKDGLMPRPSLMERNPTAHTYEWDDDSIDSSENSQSPSKKLRLPSPKRGAVSPLKLLENKRFLRRRKRKYWSLLEEDTLREAVTKHGTGNWKFILSCYTQIFEDRTEVDLKDKWRNMIRH